MEDNPRYEEGVRWYLKWIYVLLEVLGTIIGVRGIPLIYVLRADILVAPAMPLITDWPFSEIHSSIRAELIARASHDHPIFGDDSAKVFQFFEEATRLTSIAPTLAPFKRAKDERGAFNAVKAQHAGIDKRESVIKTAESFLKSSKFKGNNNYTLEKHCDGHRQNYISMQEASEHVPVQLPNERSRVTYLLDSIECQDPYVIVGLAQIRVSDPGLRTEFEGSVTALLPNDPVIKKKGKNEANKLANISGIEFKKGRGVSCTSQAV